jgi:hypothetical protein
MLYTTKYNTIWRTCQVELFLLLFIKHAIFDLGLQPMGTGPYKLVYIGKAHLWHYGPHGLGTMLILALYTPLELAVLLGLLDYVLHWHTDFFKTHIRAFYNWNNKQRQFWLLNAVDQILHFLGYYLIVQIVLANQLLLG